MSPRLQSGCGRKQAMSAAAAIVGALLVLSFARGAVAQSDVARLRGALTPDAQLQHYEWIEQTVVSLRGEDKVRRLERCFYGEDLTIPQRVPIAPDAEEEKRRKAVRFTKADAETLQVAGLRMARYVVALQAATDSMFAADSTLRQAREAHFTIKDYPSKGENLVFEAEGMKTRMYVREGEGHEIFTMEVQYAAMDGAFIPVRQTIDMSRYALTVVSEKSGFKKKRG